MNEILEGDAPFTDANRRVRYKLLDAWRGLAALAVVALHGVVPLLDGPLKELADGPWGLLLYGALGVQFFFVISGYCIAGAAVQHLVDFGDPWPFVRARVRRIWPAYLASVLLALLARHLHDALASGGAIVPIGSYPVTLEMMTSPKWLIAHFTITQVPLGTKMLIGLYWTLCYEVAFYAVVAVLLVPLWRLSWRGVLGTMHVLTLVALALLVLKPEWRFFPFDLWPLFGLGVLLYDLTRHPNNRGLMLTAIAATILVVSFVWLHSWGGEGLMLTSRVQFGAALGFTFLLWVLRRYDNELSHWSLFRGLGHIGVFSYSLYLAHIPLRGIFLGIFSRLGLITPQTLWLVPTLFIPLSLLGGWLFHLAFERPWIKNKLPRWIYGEG
jgi:exopolysaccharide production protein ExoZ